ncbi:MAG: hypothetical protein ABI315_12450 [Bacteroidia bacterium]
MNDNKNDNKIQMDEPNDLTKYFDSNQYVTTIIGSEEEKKAEPNEDKISTLVSLLTDPSNKVVKEQTLITLKKEKAGEVLLLAIAKPSTKTVRNLLVAACWESEINFSKYIPFFILLALDTDYLVSLEAITTIENMEGPFVKEDIKAAIKKVKEHQKKINTEQTVLLNDLIVTLENYLSAKTDQ